jgi:hypothetical protein
MLDLLTQMPKEQVGKPAEEQVGPEHGPNVRDESLNGLCTHDAQGRQECPSMSDEWSWIDSLFEEQGQQQQVGEQGEQGQQQPVGEQDEPEVGMTDVSEWWDMCMHTREKQAEQHVLPESGSSVIDGPACLSPEQSSEQCPSRQHNGQSDAQLGGPLVPPLCSAAGLRVMQPSVDQTNASHGLVALAETAQGTDVTAAQRGRRRKRPSPDQRCYAACPQMTCKYTKCQKRQVPAVSRHELCQEHVNQRLQGGCCSFVCDRDRGKHSHGAPLKCGFVVLAKDSKAKDSYQRIRCPLCSPTKQHQQWVRIG